MHDQNTESAFPLKSTSAKGPKKRVRIIKKVRVESGVWKFISLEKIGNRYLWDKRPGYYFIEWWEGKKRLREMAGQTPADKVQQPDNDFPGCFVLNPAQIKSFQHFATCLPDNGGITRIYTLRCHLGEGFLFAPNF
jgi:hypothetical protein